MTTKLKVSEKDFQRSVVELALFTGHAVHHTLDTKVPAKRIGPGFPDLVIVKPGKPVLFLELKSEIGRLSEAQKWWGEMLSKSPGCHYMLARPSDWDLIEGVLRG